MACSLLIKSGSTRAVSLWRRLPEAIGGDILKMERRLPYYKRLAITLSVGAALTRRQAVAVTKLRVDDA